MKKLLLAITIAFSLFACEKEEALNISPETDTVTVINNYYNTDTLVINDTLTIEQLDSIYFTDTIYRIDTIKIDRTIPEEFEYYIITRSVTIQVVIDNEIITIRDFDTLGLNTIDNYLVMIWGQTIPIDTLTIEDFEEQNFIIYDI